VLARITPTTDYARSPGCDLIVEAVFEDPAVKAEVTGSAEAVSRPTRSSPPTPRPCRSASSPKASQRPARAVHRHPLLLPVDKMMLVEIIRGRETGDRAVAKALDFVRQIRKTPIVVNDARFFYANRCIIPYLNEGHADGAEGVAPAAGRERGRLVGIPSRPAAAGRRDLDRPRGEDRQGHEGGDGRRLSRRSRWTRCVLDGR
jgi:3-hydroxyacyl-CoA dehydrogenase / enoyl-CoA hydratase / 3-hydroxybutyryl-CoA epimerase